MTPEEIVADVEGLVSLPDVVMRANELLDAPGAGAAEIGEIVQLDPGLSAQLLKLCNSAFYGLPGKIDTISRAITVVGVRELRSLILSASAVTAFSKIAPDLVDMDAFWHRSVFAALAARKLGQRLKLGGLETLFLAGLLHDVGKLVVFSRLPGQAGQILVQAKQTGQPVWQLERESLGFASAEVGAALLTRWKLGDSICQPIREQHSQADDLSDASRVLQIAIAVSDCLEPEVKAPSPCELGDLRIRAGLLTQYQLTEDDLAEVAFDLNVEALEVLSVINPNALTIF